MKQETVYKVMWWDKFDSCWNTHLIGNSATHARKLAIAANVKEPHIKFKAIKVVTTEL